MGSSSREEIASARAALRAAVSRVLELSYDVLNTAERMDHLADVEQQCRRLPAAGHAVLNQLAEQATQEELGDTLAGAVADRLRITKAEAGRRIAEAEDLGPRRALTGEPLPPRLAATAAALREGHVGAAHIRVIRRFLQKVPVAVDVFTREAAEADLVDKARGYRPDQVAGYAQALMDCLHPDGDYSDEERARRRGVAIGNQEYDGMSRISGLLTPEARAVLEAALAALAAPGRCNPDESACSDTRSTAQRNHDGLMNGLEDLLASGRLGQHNGLPTTVIVTTTLKDLESGAGYARTAGGSRLPMSDLLGMAANAHHYLAIFDGAKPLSLYHSKRLASPAQRIMLLAKDGGCTRPGCDVPGYWTQVHHVRGYQANRRTDIHELALACGPDNRLIEETGWTTRTNANGDTEAKHCQQTL